MRACLGVPRTTVHAWVSPLEGRPLLTVDPVAYRQISTPFVGFVEAVLLSGFWRAGLSIASMRSTIDVLVQETGIDHVLASRRLVTECIKALLDHEAGSDRGKLKEVIDRHLECVGHDKSGWADSVRLPLGGDDHLVVDPKIAFGRPMIIPGGARVEDIVDRFRAGDSIGEIAADFGVARAGVEEAVRRAIRTAG